MEGYVSFFWIMQSLTPLWKKIVANSGVLGDLINYRSLCSPYNTQYCAIFMERTVFYNVHLKIKKKKYSNQWL